MECYYGIALKIAFIPQRTKKWGPDILGMKVSRAWSSMVPSILQCQNSFLVDKWQVFSYTNMHMCTRTHAHTNPTSHVNKKWSSFDLCNINSLHKPINNMTMGYMWTSNLVLTKPTLSIFEERERRHTVSTVTFTDLSSIHSGNTYWSPLVCQILCTIECLAASLAFTH